ncbi:MAG: DUF2235 domain-containing protein [Tateyamaria sp.]
MPEWLRARLTSSQSQQPRGRGPVAHLIILDGTMSSLRPGHETHAGTTYKMVRETGAGVSVYYEAGIQLRNWRDFPNVIAGRGINRMIRRAYGYLASRYRPGDKIFLMGYSRGAYAVRSLAGAIDQVGLVKAEEATERKIRDVYRHYECNPEGETARTFATAYCHADVEIEMIGVWDTVKSLGIIAPILWRLSVKRHAFHSHALGRHVRHGYHALAHDETRVAYKPVMWKSVDACLDQNVEQVWFPGTHGDIGGHLGGYEPARTLANIPLVWMLDKAEGCGLPLPENWRDRFPTDPNAPSMGKWRGYGSVFITRRSRIIGQDPSERLHESIEKRAESSGIRSWWGTTREI